MTAEIAVYNSDAVAVAADSAITVGGRRVWEYGNKIFSMGPHHELGIMYFNNADVGGIPLETVIKTFKKEHYETPFSTVGEFKRQFFEYLSRLLSEACAEDIETAIILTIGIFNNTWMDIVEFNEPDEDEEESDEETDYIILNSQSIERFQEAHGSDLDLPEVAVAEFCESVKEALNEYVFELITEDMPYIKVEDDFDFSAFLKVALQSTVLSESFTGVVFFGFGRNEIFPSICVATIDGAATTWLRTWDTRNDEHDSQDNKHSGIISFAQSDMAKLFMTGILPEGEKALHVLLEKYLKEDSNSFMQSFQSLLDEFITHPIVSAIQSLPKEEMAIVAESLVDLTSLRRKIDSDVRSVGGPVDVALVSKGDGFIWIKRKHYFDPSINREFLSRTGI